MNLYGAGGHAKVIIDILRANDQSIDILFDDNDLVYNILGYHVEHNSNVQGPLIISIGDNLIRKRLSLSLNIEFGKAIHPSAIISQEAAIEVGTVVMQGAIIQSCTTIGKHCIINTGASIDHECCIDNYVHISPHSTLCGQVHIGEGSLIGAGSVIIPGITIGKWSIIGAGSVVTRDIPDHVLALGNRCRIIKKIE